MQSNDNEDNSAAGADSDEGTLDVDDAEIDADEGTPDFNDDDTETNARVLLAHCATAIRIVFSSETNSAAAGAITASTVTMERGAARAEVSRARHGARQTPNDSGGGGGGGGGGDDDDDDDDDGEDCDCVGEDDGDDRLVGC
jgi:hypothetical protein